MFGERCGWVKSYVKQNTIGQGGKERWARNVCGERGEWGSGLGIARKREVSEQ